MPVSHVLVAAAAAAALAGGAPRADSPGPYSGTPVLQPTTYASPSGSWALRVEPSSRVGAGPGRHEVSREGAKVASVEHPFTLHAAAIDDRGYSAGYCFPGGLDGRDGEFVVAILGPDGSALRVERKPREWSRFHQPPFPFGRGVAVSAELDLAVFRVADENFREDEPWWSYRLSTGEPLGEIRPEGRFERPETLLFSCALAPVRGTPLFLAHWYERTSGNGARFALIDGDLAPVWELDWPADCVDPATGETIGLFETWSGGAVLGSPAPGRFELRSFASNARVELEARRDEAAAKGWSVSEISREPWTEARPPGADPATLALLELESAPLDFGAPCDPGAVRVVLSFRPLADGGVEFLRGSSHDREWTLVTLSADGRVAAEATVPSPDPEGDRWWIPVPLAGGDWLLAASSIGTDEGTRAWMRRREDGATVTLDVFGNAAAERFAARPGGGFVTLVQDEGTYSSKVVAFDGSGRREWELAPVELDELEGIVGARDVAVAADGAVFVLDDVRIAIFELDPRGAVRRSIDLAAAWGAEPSLASRLWVASDGDPLVHDFMGEPEWRWMTRAGELEVRPVPCREGGAAVDPSRHELRFAADGTLWGTDGREIFVFDDLGLARRRFGVAADPHRLHEPGNTFLDGAGRIAVVDERTHAVHLFAANGSRELVCAPEPADFDGDWICGVAAAPDGTVYVRSLLEDRVLAFESDGRRRGRVELGGEIFELAKDGTGWVVVEGDDDSLHVRRFGTAGAARIDRLPDGRFFREIRALGVSRDGALAVVDVFGSSGPPGVEGSILALYTRDGAPWKSIELPSAADRGVDAVDLGMQRAVVSCASACVVVDLPSGRVSTFEPPDAEAAWTYGLSPDERELWAVRADPPALRRFELPR